MRVRGILIATVAAVTLWANPADAAKPGMRASAVTLVNGGPGGPGTPVSAVARCPKGRKAVAGGYETSRPQSLTRRVVVQESRMVKGTGWRVTAFEASAAPAADGFTAVVYCVKRKRALEVGSPIRTDFLPDAGKSTSSAAECPPHTTAFSGGFSAPLGDVYFYRSRRSGRFWEVGLTNVSGSGGAPYVAEAYCGRGEVITRSATVPGAAPVDPGGSADTANCPAGTFPRSGGFDTSETTGGLATAALVFQTFLAHKTWIASAVTPGVQGAAVTAYTYCRA